MHQKEFNNLFLKSLSDKLNKTSNKEIMPTDVDFNIDLIKTNSNNNNASECFDIIYSSYLIPHITCSVTRLTRRSHTLIDNVMSNVILEDAILGNFVNTISDHLGKFLIKPYQSIISNSKPEFSKETSANSCKSNFLSDFKKRNWKSLFSQHKQDVKLSTKIFLDKITHLVYMDAPITKLSIKEKKNLETSQLRKEIL